MIVKTEGVVLKSFDLRETSRIVTLFTEDQGKIKGVFKGIRKDPRKFGSSVDRFSVNDIVYYRHRNSDIHLVGQCDMKEYFLGLRQDLKRLTAASYAGELLDALMPLEQENREVYGLFLDYLRALQDIDDIGKLVHIFQIKMLLFSGFKPHLDSCVRCESKIAGQARFSLKMGGLVCVQCRDFSGQGVPITQGAIASILHIESQPWPRVLRLGLEPSIKKELKYILNHFLVFNLERHLKATRYL